MDMRTHVVRTEHLWATIGYYEGVHDKQFGVYFGFKGKQHAQFRDFYLPHKGATAIVRKLLKEAEACATEKELVEFLAKKLGAKPTAKAKVENPVYNDYMMAGNQGYYRDKAEAEYIHTHGFTDYRDRSNADYLMERQHEIYQKFYR
jgi:hypothetical protein